jgi:2-polyprenyl-3-methyl-5-hydroxy-6-metoxy-1,4-benzoquinol methylase
MSEFCKQVRERFQGRPCRVLDVGSMGVNGTYKELFQFEGVEYVGLDAAAGPNVDVVPADSYDWKELEDESFDVIVSGQVLEHVEFPWLTVEQIAKKLKSNGMACVIAPSRGPEHRYPHDCYRYYPDGMKALMRWTGLRVLEADYVRGGSGFKDGSDQWGDCYCIVVKDPEENPAVEAKRNNRRQPNLPPMSGHTHSPLTIARASSYNEPRRPEVVGIIERLGIPTQRILELGCSTGATCRDIRDRLANTYYEGLELSEQAAATARGVLDKVQVADIETASLADLGLKTSDFDMLLGIDIFEHLYDPWETLAKFVACLKPGGYAVLSVMNVQNITILEGLTRGAWRYERAGLLDVSHLRFFTMGTIQELVVGARLQIVNQAIIFNPSLDLNRVLETGNTLTREKFHLMNLTRDEVIQLYAHQYIVTARKSG